VSSFLVVYFSIYAHRVFRTTKDVGAPIEVKLRGLASENTSLERVLAAPRGHTLARAKKLIGRGADFEVAY
jgi:hypothetical protein